MKRTQEQGPVTRRDALAWLAALALTSAGARAQGKSAKPAKPATAAGPPLWDDRMEMGIDFEINPPDGFRYRPPYVAVWLEDRNGSPVRTLSLWVEYPRGSRWIPDLRRWYRDGEAVYESGGPDLITTASSATRMPGRYSLVWNGRDDRGRPVPQGTYTVNLETAREHGPYTLMQKTINIGAKPFTTEAAGNEELKGATIEYRKRA